jgi:hypothetical protein
LSRYAAARQIFAAIKTRAAARRERAEDQIAFPKIFDGFPQLDYLAGEFVSHHGSRIKSLFSAVINVQIRAANRGEMDFDNGIAGRFDFRVGDGFVVNVFDAVKGERVHGDLVLLRSTPDSKQKPRTSSGLIGLIKLSFDFLQLARGFLAFGAGLALLAPFHAHAALLAFASRHNAPKQVNAVDGDLLE